MNETENASQGKSPREDPVSNDKPLLQVKDLVTYFFTEEGIVRAVEGVSFDMKENEVVGLVGETGCGKSVTALSVIQLVRQPGKIIAGEVWFKGTNLLELPEEKVRELRGNQITMIFQDPMNSLNPVLTVKQQLREVFLLHQKEDLIKNREQDYLAWRRENPGRDEYYEQADAIERHKKEIQGKKELLKRVSVKDKGAGGETERLKEEITNLEKKYKEMVPAAKARMKEARKRMKEFHAERVREIKERGTLPERMTGLFRTLHVLGLLLAFTGLALFLGTMFSGTEASEFQSMNGYFLGTCLLGIMLSLTTFLVHRHGDWSVRKPKNHLGTFLSLEAAVVGLNPYHVWFLLSRYVQTGYPYFLSVLVFDAFILIGTWYLAQEGKERIGGLLVCGFSLFSALMISYTDPAHQIATGFAGLIGGFLGLKSVDEIQNPKRRSLKYYAKLEAIKALEKVKIADPEKVINSYPHELSGGMRQRVMIAMALACNPALLIADEPTTALDVTIQAQILKLMRDLNEQYRTAILLITHDLGVIAEMCNRVAVMYSGRIIEYGNVVEIFKRPLHPYTNGLLASIPKVEERKEKLATIKGSVPNLIYPPRGCRFHPRCPKRMNICDKQLPPLISVGENHQVACFLHGGYEETPANDDTSESVQDQDADLPVGMVGEAGITGSTPGQQEEGQHS